LFSSRAVPEMIPPAQHLSMRRLTLHTIISLLLAANYCAFQIELFDCEYEANHPRSDGSNVITAPTITWETFDKQNAPKAFVVDAGMRVEVLFLLPPASPAPALHDRPFQPVRDKSPPVAV
jgi:hypothetical protein